MYSTCDLLGKALALRAEAAVLDRGAPFAPLAERAVQALSSSGLHPGRATC